MARFTPHIANDAMSGAVLVRASIVFRKKARSRQAAR